jgi:class II flagellar assembly regulator FliX
MKIDRVSSIGTKPSRRTSRGGSSKSSSFSKALGGSPAPAPSSVSGNGALGPVDALLALQEVAGEPNREAAARQRGEDLLDRLDELRLALLDGRLPRAVIERLAAVVGAQRAKIDDPQMIEVLDEIELRAAVELAKLDR